MAYFHGFHLHQAFVRNGYGFDLVAAAAGPAMRRLSSRAGDQRRAGRPAAYTAPATFYLHIAEAQQLMDELWRVGLRPSEGTGSAGSLRQAEDHIASLKAIAFKLVGVEGKR